MLESETFKFRLLYTGQMVNYLRMYIKAADLLPKIGKGLQEYQEIDMSISAFLREEPKRLEQNILGKVIPDTMIAAQHGEHLVNGVALGA